MIYRKATLNDAEEIGTILKESYNIKTIKEGIEAFKEEFANGFHYIVAEENGNVVGLVTWIKHGLPKHELVELDRIAVLPAFRGKGIANGLFDALIESANEHLKKHGFKLRKLYILTHASNKRAQTFYEKMGCKHETTLKSHFYDKEDEFVYSRFFISTQK